MNQQTTNRDTGEAAATNAPANSGDIHIDSGQPADPA